MNSKEITKKEISNKKISEKSRRIEKRIRAKERNFLKAKQNVELIETTMIENRKLKQKMKNRIAAQNSRDKKKLYVCNLEAKNKILQEENIFLVKTIEELKKERIFLMKEIENQNKKEVSINLNENSNDLLLSPSSTRSSNFTRLGISFFTIISIFCIINSGIFIKNNEISFTKLSKNVNNYSNITIFKKSINNTKEIILIKTLK